MSHANTMILQRELDYFEQHRFELVARAAGKYALVKHAALAGIYDSEIEAVREGYRAFGNEAFLVKHIVEVDVPLTIAECDQLWAEEAEARYEDFLAGRTEAVDGDEVFAKARARAR